MIYSAIALCLVCVIIAIAEIVQPGCIIKSRKKREKGPRPAPKLIDEVSIAVSFFGKDRVEIQDLEKFLKLPFIEPDTLKALQTICNTHSRAGFMRYVKYGAEKDVYKQEAAVLICYMLDLTYPPLWEYEFMDEKDCRDYMNVIGA